MKENQQLTLASAEETNAPAKRERRAKKNKTQKADDKLQNLVVVKSNDLIQSSRFDLSVTEQKILLSVISQVKPEDTKFEVCQFSISQFCNICGVNRDGRAYERIRDAIKGLADKSVFLPLPGTETLSLYRWIDKVLISEDTGLIQIVLDQDMTPYLLQLKKRYTAYSLYYTLPMKSKYSIRLYELLKSYANLTESIVKSVEELRTMLQCDGTDNKSRDGKRSKGKTIYPQWGDFKRYVLDTACEEINLYTDLKVSYAVQKTGRSISHVVFTIEMRDEAESNSRLSKVEANVHNARSIGNAMQAMGEPYSSPTEEIVYTYNPNITIPYYIGANKKNMIRAIEARFNRQELEAVLTESQQAGLENIIAIIAELCGRHHKKDVMVDGGNKANILAFNNIIVNEKVSVQEFLEALAVQYDPSHFWKGKEIANKHAYLSKCVEKDMAQAASLIYTYRAEKAEKATNHLLRKPNILKKG